MRTASLVLLTVLTACGRFDPVDEKCYRPDEPWTRVAMDPDLFLDAIWGSGPDDVWAVGGGILRWQGDAWKKVPSPTTTTLEGIWGSGPNDVWAAGCAGTIIRWDGTEWSKVNSGTSDWKWNECFYGIGGSGPNDVWAVGDNGRALHWNGMVWKTFTAGTETFFEVSSNQPNDALLVGGKGQLAHWDGTELRTESSGTDMYLQGVWGIGGEYWIAAETHVLHRTSAGKPLEKIPVVGAIVQTVWGTSNTDVWLTSSEGIVIHFDGTRWQPACGTGRTDDTRIGIGAMWRSPKGGAWAVGSKGFILRGP